MHQITWWLWKLMFACQKYFQIKIFSVFRYCLHRYCAHSPTMFLLILWSKLIVHDTKMNLKVRELFKGSNGSTSLVDCTRKKCIWLGGRIFCEWRHKWSSFRVILAHVAWPRAQPLGQSVSLKFLLETRLESKSFEPLINFLAYLVQKLLSKINKLIDYLIS